MKTYAIYGVKVQTDCVFGERLTPSFGPPDLVFTCRPKAALTQRIEELPLLYESEPLGDLKRRIQLYASGEGEILRFEGITDYVIGAHRIECYLRDPDLGFLIEIQALGIVLAYWLERRGILALHASGVVIGDTAVGFVAANKGGKTTLAAALLRAGHGLLTDDLLAVEVSAHGVLAHPGYPQMRMWPEDAEYFHGSSENLELAHPGFDKRRVRVDEHILGGFHTTSVPLKALYIPARRVYSSGGAEIELLPSAAAMQQLLGASFTDLPTKTASSSGHRLRLLAQLLQTVPVRRLSYPEGRGRLGDVVAAIENDDARRS